MKSALRPGLATPQVLVRLFQRRVLPLLPSFALSSVLYFSLLPRGHALPTGAEVRAGRVDITQAGNTLNVAQGSKAAVVNWQQFNIAANEQVRVQQPGVDAAMLARVTGGDPSQLLGQLKADGKLFLINPRGILVGQGAVIDTAAFLASTLDVSDEDFMKGGALTFKGDAKAGVVNLGQITAREGNVLLVAANVKNAGEISAPNGTAGLAAGTEVYLAAPDTPTFVVRTNVTTPAGGAGVENSGVIAAAQAELKAAGGSIYDLAVNQSGVVRATGIDTRNGRVILTADGGNVVVSGSVTARNAGGAGGEILVGGDYQGGNRDVANAANTTVAATATLDASATSDAGKAGRVIVWSDLGTQFLGRLEAKGAGGGFAEVSGKHVLDFRPAATLDLGRGGTLLLDPDAIHIGTAGTNPGNAGSFIDVATLHNQLEASNVTLDASGMLGEVTFAADFGWTTASTLRVNSFNDILIEANITAPAGTLALFPGRNAEDTTPIQGEGVPRDIYPSATLEGGYTLTVDKVIYGTNPAPLPTGWVPMVGSTGTSAAGFYGTLRANTLEINLDNGGAGVVVSDSNENTAVRNIRTTGSGDLNYFFVWNDQGDLNLQLNSTTSTAGVLTAITPGALTLEAGTSLNLLPPASDPTIKRDVRLVSTGGSFVNQAGAGVFGSSVRFLISAPSPGAVLAGGLTAGAVYNHPFDVWEEFADTQNRFLYSGASTLPILTYTANNIRRFYGALNPTLTTTVTGLQGADVLANVVTGAPVISTTATQSSGVGGFQIDITRGSLLSSTYDFAFVPGTLTIDAAPLTITANSTNRRLNRDNPTLTASFTGLVNGETSAVVSGLQLATTAVLASPEGLYPITASGATAPNYAITYVPGTLTVSGDARLTIAADNKNRTYGAANPLFTATITGFEGSDTASIVTGLQFNTAATQSSGIGLYTITPFGAAAPTYAIDYISGTLTIDRAPLLITPASASRAYGDANPTLTANFSGLVNSETSSVVTGLALATDATAQSNVGGYAITGSGASAANYAISYAPGTLNVTPASLIVRSDAITRLYGDPNPTLTYSVTGLKNGDTAASVFQLTQLETLAQQTDPIGLYGTFIDGYTLSSNYTPVFQSGGVRITQRPITIRADNITKVYGDPFPEAYTATISNLAPFDTPSAITNVHASLLASVADGVQTVGIGVTSDRTNQNYAISYQFGQLSITPAPLTFSTPLGELFRTYGRANPVVSNFLVGLKYADTADSVRLRYVLPAPTANAGTYTYYATVDNANYSFAPGVAGTFHVEPAPLTVNLGSTGRLYGETTPVMPYTVAGLAFGDTADATVKVINPTDASTPVGVYNLVPQVLSPNYYVQSTNGGRLQINPRLLTLDINNIARYYGNPTADFSWVLGGDGVAPVDSLGSIFLGVKTAVPVDITTNVGLYRLDPMFRDDPNYRISWTPGYLAVLPRPIEIAVNNAVSFGHDNVPPDFAYTNGGLDLVRFHDANAGSAGVGYTVNVTGLPSFVTTAEALPRLFFTLVNTNQPAAIGEAVSPDKYVFPARPSRTAPQAPADPVPDTVGPNTVAFTPGKIVIPDTAPTVSYPVIMLDGGTFTITGMKLSSELLPKDESPDRFADVIRYVQPSGYTGGNYVVTKVTNGVLTMKADPVVVADTLAAEAIVAKRKADTDAFYNPGGPLAPGEIRLASPVAFGLPRDLIPTIRYAVANALNGEILGKTAGLDGALAKAINGGNEVASWDQLPNDKIMAWLADIHTNPAKQALVMPALMSYAMAVAGKDPSSLTGEESKLLAFISPALGKARDSFLDNVDAARDTWVATEGASRSATFSGLLDGKQPYDKFISEGVAKTMEGAMQKFEAKAAGADPKNLGIGLGAGGAAGLTTGIIFGMESVFKSISPNTAARITLTTARALRDAKAGLDVAKNTMTMGKAASTMGGGVGTIVSLAVTILITEATNVADNEKARTNFDNLLATRNSPVASPQELMKSEQGRAIMMLGMTNLFLGGG